MDLMLLISTALSKGSVLFIFIKINITLLFVRLKRLIAELGTFAYKNSRESCLFSADSRR
jgi:hypothetical protein